MAKKELPIIKKTESGLPVLSYPSSKEEVSTSDSQTPVQPSTESGEEIEQEVKQEGYKEPDFFTGKFGSFLKAFDAANPYKIPVGEFIDDMGRAISGGQKQGSTVGDALYVMTKGKNVSDEDIQAYIDIVNESQNQPVSEAMFKFQKELQEKANQNEDKQPTFWDVFSSLNAGVVPEIIVSSLSAMVNPESAAAAGTIVGGSAAGGALFGGAGAVPAALASTPYALAAAGTTLETAVTFSELLQNELAKEQKEFNKENVKELLQNEDKLNSIRAKAVGRGFTIGAIDAMTGKLGGSVGAKVAKKAFKGAKPLGVATTSVIESVGGSGGEAAGRLVAGQEMDKSEIVLEGIGEIGQAPLQFGSAMLNTDIDEVKKSREAAKKKANLKGEGFYEVNGEVVTREQLTDMLKNMTEDDLTSELKIDIENDPEMTQMVNDLFSFAETKQKVKSANPNLSEDNLVEVARREQEISMLKDNDTETAKERVSQLKEEIKSIQEKPQESKGITLKSISDELESVNKELEELYDNQESIQNKVAKSPLKVFAKDVVSFFRGKKPDWAIGRKKITEVLNRKKQLEDELSNRSGNYKKSIEVSNDIVDLDEKAEKDLGIDEIPLFDSFFKNTAEDAIKFLKDNGFSFDENKYTEYYNKRKELGGELGVALKNFNEERIQEQQLQESKDITLQEEQKGQDITEQKQTEQKQQDNAIQEQATNESVLRQEQPEVELQEVVEGDQKQEVVTEEGKPQEEVVDEKETIGKKIRGFAKSTTEAYTDLKQRIEKNPENYYEPQVWESMKDKLSEMTDEEVIESMSNIGLNSIKDGEDNNAVLAAIELINRRQANDMPIDDIVEIFSKEGTKMGQLVAQFNNLKNSTPFGVMSTIAKAIEQQGKIMSKEQKKKTQDLADDMLKKNAKLKQYIKQFGGKASKENITEMKNLQKDAEDASRKFFNYTSSFTPMKWSDILSMTVQGNLLTPISQATNIIANVSQQGLMLPVDFSKNLVDLVRSVFTKERVGSLDPKKYVAGWIGAAIGLTKAWNTMVKGGSDYAKGEVKRSFKPFTAISQSLSDTYIGDKLGIEQGLLPKTLSKKGKELITKAKKLRDEGKFEEASKLEDKALAESKVSFDDRAKKIYESFFGIAPEIMFRLLSFGDKPFYYFTEYKNLYVEGKRKGLKGDELRNYVMMPDAATLEKVSEESAESVFMEEGAASRTAIHITSSVDRALKGIKSDDYFGRLAGAALSFLFKTQVPYVKTPTNIISQTIDFAIPPVAIAKAVSAYRSGNKKAGDKNVGIAITGLIIGNVSALLISEGLVSSPFDFGDDKEDERNIKYSTFPPNHLNISGVERLINGEDPSIREGDTTIDLRKLGILGALVLIRSSQNKRLYKEEKSKAVNINKEISSLDKLAAWVGAPIDVIKYSMEQSFLAGTATLLDALKGGKGTSERWAIQTLRAMSTVPLPNTFSALTRATDTYLYDTRADEVPEMLQALYQERLGWTSLPESVGIEFPIRVDMWGNPVRRTPEGKNPYFHQFFDVSKSQKVPKDKLNLEVYNLYRNTLNPKVVPNLPPRYVFIDGDKYYIPKTKEGNEIYNEYASVLGKERKKYAEKAISRNSYKKATIEKKAEKLASEMQKASNSPTLKRYKKELIKTLKSKKFD